MTNRMIYAPFSQAQVIVLNQRQRSSRPFTCATHGYDGILVATVGGWRCTFPGCEFIQLWAPELWTKF